MIAGVLIFLVALLALPLVGALLGAFAGLVVGVVFSGTFDTWLVYFGLADRVAPWQVGAMLGFVGPFFRSISSSK